LAIEYGDKKILDLLFSYKKVKNEKNKLKNFNQKN
jgi:hypothetical protein